MDVYLVELPSVQNLNLKLQETEVIAVRTLHYTEWYKHLIDNDPTFVPSKNISAREKLFHIMSERYK